MTEDERYEQYLICKQRGHVANENTSFYFGTRSSCKHCQVVFWNETVVQEMFVPINTEE